MTELISGGEVGVWLNEVVQKIVWNEVIRSNLRTTNSI